MTQWILAINGQPFVDRDAADLKRDLLAAELGNSAHLEVLPHPDGGYVVAAQSLTATERAGPADRAPVIELERARSRVRSSFSESPREQLEHLIQRDVVGDPATLTARTRRSQTEQTRESATPSEQPLQISRAYPESFRLSPSPRAFIGQHLQALIGALLLLQPHLAFRLVGMTMPQNRTSAAAALGAIGVVGLMLLLLSVLRFLWAYTANTYVVDANGIEQIQWYFERGRLRRRAPRISFTHLRTVEVDQSVLQMLLNVGSVKLAAGATDSYEVVLRQVSAPRALREEFQNRLRLLSPLGEAALAQRANEI